MVNKSFVIVAPSQVLKIIIISPFLIFRITTHESLLAAPSPSPSSISITCPRMISVVPVENNVFAIVRFPQTSVGFHENSSATSVPNNPVLLLNYKRYLWSASKSPTYVSFRFYVTKYRFYISTVTLVRSIS